MMAKKGVSMFWIAAILCLVLADASKSCMIPDAAFKPII